MNGRWADNLAEKRSSTSSQKMRKSKNEQSTSQKNVTNGSSSSRFNGKEILEYLSRNYQANIEEAKKDKQGSNVRVYRSLESSSQWETKASGLKAMSARGNHHSGDNNKKKNTSGNTTKQNRTNVQKQGAHFDVLYELNKSIQHQNQQKSKNK